MYCPSCGKDNPAGAPNCHSCGTSMAGIVLPKRESSTTTIVAIVACLVGIFVVVTLGWYPRSPQSREAARKSTCVNNTRKLAVAVQLYTIDYDGRLPQFDRWCDAIRPRLQSPEAFVCPDASESKCGYGLNSNLKSMNAVQALDAVVMIYESDRGWNACGGVEAMVSKPRHNGVNVAFMDTHCQTIYDDERKRLLW